MLLRRQAHLKLAESDVQQTSAVGCGHTSQGPARKGASMQPAAADSDDESDLSLEDDSLLGPEEEEISPEDEAALRAFMAPQPASYQQQTLGDIILAKIQEKQRRSQCASTQG